MAGILSSNCAADGETPARSERYVYNAVGHAVLLVDGGCVPVQVNLYEAFGGIEASWGNSKNNRLANTKERDASIALDNHGFRYYDASNGRYISNDPIGYEGGFNLYVHCTNDPVNKFDPLGLKEKEKDKEWEKRLQRLKGESKKNYWKRINEDIKDKDGNITSKGLRSRTKDLHEQYKKDIKEKGRASDDIREKMKEFLNKDMNNVVHGLFDGDPKLSKYFKNSDSIEKSVGRLASRGGGTVNGKYAEKDGEKQILINYNSFKDTELFTGTYIHEQVHAWQFDRSGGGLDHSTITRSDGKNSMLKLVEVHATMTTARALDSIDSHAFHGAVMKQYEYNESMATQYARHSAIEKGYISFIKKHGETMGSADQLIITGATEVGKSTIPITDDGWGKENPVKYILDRERTTKVNIGDDEFTVNDRLF